MCRPAVDVAMITQWMQTNISQYDAMLKKHGAKYQGNECFDCEKSCSQKYDENKIREPFEKFVDSPYFSESELCRGAVTVSFSKYLLWQAMRFVQRSTHFSNTCCRSMLTSKFLASQLPFRGWKSPGINRMGRDLDCMADVLMGFHWSTFSKPNT
jgi:hypothetical protein